MDNKRIEAWLKRFNKRISHALSYSFPTRKIELQHQAAEELNRYLELLDKKRRKLRDENDSDAANLFLGLMCYAESVITLLNMWMAIRTDEPTLAWENLVDSQSSVRAAMRAHEICHHHLGGFVDHLLVVERIVFPDQQFVSPSFVVSKSSCSICDDDMYKCNHIPGFAYNGEFCVERVENISAADHVALVDHPEDKKRRITTIPKDDYHVDTFTLERVDADLEPNVAQMRIM